MVDITVIIPQRNALPAVAAQLARLRTVLEKISPDFEIVVVDDGSAGGCEELGKRLLNENEPLRIIELDEPLGISAALTAGLAAARGRRIVLVEAGDAYPAEELEKLLLGLRRADLVYGRRPLSGLGKLWHRIARIPRWLLLGLEVREPDSTFWAARAEALAGLELARGMYRYLATLVAMRGYRVNEVYVETNGPGRPLTDCWPNPGDLLCVWWLQRRWREARSRELGADQWPESVFPISQPLSRPTLAAHDDSSQRSA